jgi:DNA-binding IclR family transcriptional regulator
VRLTADARPAAPRLLERAFALLALFDEERPSWTTTEAAREVGLPVPTAHRILAVLAAQGFVARDEDKRFTLGRAALRFGRRSSTPAATASSARCASTARSR